LKKSGAAIKASLGEADKTEDVNIQRKKMAILLS
jgi:hypothetical protein